jgi:hypothetical protein
LDVHSDDVGSGCPLLYVHVPGCEPLHVPFEHEDVVQQTPSTQVSALFLQSVVLVQGAPVPSSATHEPALQKKPTAQSVLSVQVVLHAVPTQPKTPHDFVVKLHAPAPLQPFGSSSFAPPHVDDDEHLVVLPGK